MPAPLAPPTSGEIARQIARRAGRAAIALILLAAVSSRTSADANVLFNPELDQVLLHSGWRIYFGSMLDWTGADSTGCAGSGAGQLESATTDVGTEWGEAGVPATTQRVFVTVGAEAYQPAPMELLFDRAFFGRVPVVFTDGFETAGSLCRWQ